MLGRTTVYVPAGTPLEYKFLINRCTDNQFEWEDSPNRVCLPVGTKITVKEQWGVVDDISVQFDEIMKRIIRGRVFMTRVSSLDSNSSCSLEDAATSHGVNRSRINPACWAVSEERHACHSNERGSSMSAITDIAVS